MMNHQKGRPDPDRAPTNSGTGIEQSFDKKHPIQLFNSDGSAFKYDSNIKNKAAYRVFPFITYNTNGPFFNKFDTSHKVGGYDSGYGRSELLQIFHELAHVVFDETAHTLIKDDGPSSGVDPSENTEIVKRACQKEIEAAYER